MPHFSEGSLNERRAPSFDSEQVRQAVREVTSVSGMLESVTSELMKAWLETAYDHEEKVYVIDSDDLWKTLCQTQGLRDSLGQYLQDGQMPDVIPNGVLGMIYNSDLLLDATARAKNAADTYMRARGTDA